MTVMGPGACGPIDDKHRRNVMICMRARALGFEQLDFGTVGMDDRYWWRTPAGHVLYVTYDNLEEILNRNPERWWAWEAAHWEAP